MDAVARASSVERLFLVVGRSWDIHIDQELMPFDDSCEEKLRRRVADEGVARGVWWIDFFVFRVKQLGADPSLRGWQTRVGQLDDLAGPQPAVSRR